MLTILFFGHLKEVLKTESIQVDLAVNSDAITTVSKLRNMLQSKGEMWSEYLAYGKALVAVNQEMTSDATVLKEGDEIAFFPPVTGG
ncbi:molybdopterin converting factor subunit 1 [uncultured Paraglaciecola sp.]|uniref:molybdopterin converting factor subunit 1 n=1 Tax=uncultured Paraglaciecola sp. TaxID=1765024 RepID=UPI0030DB61C6